MAARKKEVKKASPKKNGGGGKLDSASVSPKAELIGLKKKSDNSTSYNRKDMSYSSSIREKNPITTPTQSVSASYLKKNRSVPSKGTYGTKKNVNKLK